MPFLIFHTHSRHIASAMSPMACGYARAYDPALMPTQAHAFDMKCHTLAQAHSHARTYTPLPLVPHPLTFIFAYSISHTRFCCVTHPFRACSCPSFDWRPPIHTTAPMAAVTSHRVTSYIYFNFNLHSPIHIIVPVLLLSPGIYVVAVILHRRVAYAHFDL